MYAAKKSALQSMVQNHVTRPERFIGAEDKAKNAILHTKCTLIAFM